MLDWLIIGGGIHGTAISHYLVTRKKVPPDNLRVLDPHTEPLALWKQFTANTGMPYLRSPLVHHLHYDPWSARTFAESRRGQTLADFIALYERPSLAFFNTFSDLTIERYKLTDLRLIGRASGLSRLENGWRVETPDGGIDSQRVILAMGASEQPFYPDWARDFKLSDGAVEHIFDPDFDREKLPQNVTIIGGGISAAQLAITLAESGHQVTLMSRHQLRMAHFDSDPCWVTRLCLADFHAEPDFNKRRAMIKSARNRGSMPPDVLQRLEATIEGGNLRVQFDEVASAQEKKSEITLKTINSEILHTDAVVLATGFTPKRPGGVWLDEAITHYDFPLADDGYPVVDRTLCWSEGIYVTGALAELEIGPVARNIIGARLAAERIGEVTTSHHSFDNI